MSVSRLPPPHEFKQRLLREYFVRFHMALMLLAVIASGVLASRLLLTAGLHQPIVRYPVSVFMSYGVFLGLVRIWIWFVTTNRSASLPEIVAGGAADAAEFTTDAALESSLSTRPGSLPSFGIDLDLEDGWFIVLALAMLIGAIFGTGAYLVYTAPELLGEVAFQAALASGLSRAMKRIDQPGWADSLVRGTIIPLGIVLALTIVLALVMRHECPSATRLREAIHCPETPGPSRGASPAQHVVVFPRTRATVHHTRALIEQDHLHSPRTRR